MIGRKLLGALMLLATWATVSGYASEPLRESPAMGTVIMRSPSTVTINGETMLSGTTVFRGDTIETPDGSSAVIDLRSGASVAISEDTKIVLNLAGSNAQSAQVILRHGAVNVRNPLRQPDWVTVSGASIMVSGQEGFPSVCRIAMLGQSTAIINDRGWVEIYGHGAPWFLPVGRYTQLNAGYPQGGPGAAGSVTAEIPVGNVQHSGQTAEVPLKLNDNVFANDLVSTQDLGRVRIQLKDGSVLNVGVRSQMRIVAYDPQSQTTSIDLAAGKLRSQVQKITKQGGSFKVTTKTAVIGVVGTHFLVEAAPDMTKVWCFEGVVNVQSLNPAVIGMIVLHAGEFTTIALGLPPAATSLVSPLQMSAQIHETDAGAGSGGGGGGSNTNAASVGLSVAGIGAAGAGAAVAAVAVSRAGDTSNALNEATNLLNSATGALNSASSNASNALSSANAANQGSGNSVGLLNGILQSIVSPTYPCGCH